MYDDYNIMFKYEIDDEYEEETEDFKQLIRNIKNVFNIFVGEKMSRHNTTQLFTEVERLVSEYKTYHPESTFRIRPDHKNAFSEVYLTVGEISDLHKKYCNEYHEEKSEYTRAEINNMLYDLMLIGQLNSYVSPAFTFETSLNDMIFEDTVLVSLREYNWI